MTTDAEWSLRAANEAELHGSSVRIRRATLIILAVGIGSSVAVAAALDFVGARGLAVLALVVLPLSASLISRRYRTLLSQPLEASVVIGTWLAKEGLVDPEGHLATHALQYLAIGFGDQVGQDPTQSTVQWDRERERHVAVSAYVEARERWRDGQPWLDPFRRAVTQIDTSEVRAYLSRTREAQLARMPTWAWLVVGPLAIVGAALVILTVVIAASQSLGST